ncbi:hypothetical protein ACFSO7_07195 [Bacillus sp. CGMCC 1.16607]|uniref:hypothetical protein n=1 Tax=Bacillus sp. CGMCC 1.16607 TaxID=3351842 RepID=UPI00363ECAC8
MEIIFPEGGIFLFVKADFVYFVALEQVEWLISTPGCSLSAGRAVSLLGAFRACGVSPVPLLPQESRTFRSNQPLYYLFAFSKNNILLESFFLLSKLHLKYYIFLII